MNGNVNLTHFSAVALVHVTKKENVLKEHKTFYVFLSTFYISVYIVFQLSVIHHAKPMVYASRQIIATAGLGPLALHVVWVSNIILIDNLLVSFIF